MFGFFTYPMKVSSELQKLGWSTATLPNALDSTWGGLIRALRSNGVTVKDASLWLDGALEGDIPSLERVYKNSGLYGMMFFGSADDWQAGNFNLFCK